MNKNAAARKKKNRSRQPAGKPQPSQMEIQDPSEVARVKAVVGGINKVIRKHVVEEVATR